MNYYLISLFFVILLPEQIEWEKIEAIHDGYGYTVDSNANGDTIAGGMNIDGDYAMQIYYREHNQNWIEIPGNDQVPIMSGDLLITDTQNIYVCDFAMGLYRSHDLGDTWTDLAELTNEGCSAFNIHQSGVFFAGMTYTGIGFIHRSLDDGSSWEAIPLPDYSSNYPVEHIEFDSEGNIYLGTINGIYKSTDNGSTWQKSNNGINGNHISSIFVDEDDTIYIYTTYSSQTDGMYYSTDKAESWSMISIPDYYVVDIAAQDNFIMIIDGYNNIQITEDLGNMWNISNVGLSDNSLYSLHIDNNNTIYAGGKYIHQTNDVCFDLFGLDFGPCTMVLGIGYSNGECTYISGCDWNIDGVDYSDESFESIDDCVSSCNGGLPALGDVNADGVINILDVIQSINLVLSNGYNNLADMNLDLIINILDIVLLVDTILASNDLPDECYIIPEIGPCDGICPTYYYNQSTNECEEFITGCCGLEAFNTIQDCQDICE